MENKKMLIGVIVVVLIILAGGGYFLLGNKSTKTAAPQPVATDENIPSLSAGDLGLTISARADNKALKFVIANAGDIKTIDYDLTYNADVPKTDVGDSGSGGNAQATQDIHGEGITPTNGRYESGDLTLGTCSTGKCRYDTNVSNIKLVLKITKNDNKVYQAEQTYSL